MRSVGLLIVREPLVRVVLQGGEFTAQDTERVAFVLGGYAPAIWAYSMIHVLTRAFYARGEASRPVKVAIAVVGLNLVLNCTLIWTPLREAGLAVSTAVCAVLQTIVLLRMLRTHTGRLVDRDVGRSWLSTLLAAIGMTVIVGTAAMWVPPAATWAGALATLAVLVAIGIGTVTGAALALRMPELRWALGKPDGNA